LRRLRNEWDLWVSWASLVLLMTLPEIFHRSAVMKYEIADWRFEVTWDGLFCQPIERVRMKAAKKSAVRPNQREDASKSGRHAIGLTVQAFEKQTYRKGARK